MRTLFETFAKKTTGSGAEKRKTTTWIRVPYDM